MKLINKDFNIHDLDFKDMLLSIDELLDWINDAPGEFHVSSLNRDVGMQWRYTEKLEKTCQDEFFRTCK